MELKKMGMIRKPYHWQNWALMCSKSCLSAPNRNIWVIVRNLGVPVFQLKRMVCCSHVKDIICTHTAQLYSDDQSCTEHKAQKADTHRIISYSWEFHWQCESAHWQKSSCSYRLPRVLKQKVVLKEGEMKCVIHLGLKKNKQQLQGL